MVSVVRNKITMTRGDSLILKLHLIYNNKPYVPVYETSEGPGDRIRFAMSKGYKGDLNYELLLEKPIDIQNLNLVLKPEDTANLLLGLYNYDIQITHDDGRVDTFISDTIQLLGECG